jgi:hypothetical protein
MIEPGGDWAWNCSGEAWDSAWEVWLSGPIETDRCTYWSACLVTSVWANSRCCQPRGGERHRNNLLKETYQTTQQIENKRGVRSDCTGNEQECKQVCVFRDEVRRYFHGVLCFHNAVRCRFHACVFLCTPIRKLQPFLRQFSRYNIQVLNSKYLKPNFTKSVSWCRIYLLIYLLHGAESFLRS